MATSTPPVFDAGAEASPFNKKRLRGLTPRPDVRLLLRLSNPSVEFSPCETGLLAWTRYSGQLTPVLKYLAWRVDSSKGDELAAYIEANYQELGVYYVIWEQRYLMDQGSIYPWPALPSSAPTS